MIDIITSQMSFVSLLSFFAIGAIGSLILRKNDQLSNLCISFFAIIGSIWGLIFSISSLLTGHSLSFVVNKSAYKFLSLSFNIDLLSSFFIFVISLIVLFCSIYGIGYVKHYYEKYSIGALGFFYNIFIIGMLLVVSSSNAIFFLIAWEIMSIASYLLVVYDRNDEKNVKAGFLYLIMTHVGTVFIIISFLLMYKFTGTFDFVTLKSNVNSIPLYIKDIVFVLAVIGFGTKAGIVPFHIWLPSAHPAAPSHVSALMSGVMIKTGIYMMIRIFLDILQPIPIWWGLALLILGAFSALLGILYALTEYDIKRLLAYSSIENIGIILLGLGSTFVFTSLGAKSFALLSLIATLFHILNHAIFKSLLFLGAGSVINQTHTRNIEKLGGIIKYMPQTAFFFLIGSMAISALPPFNGFFSEWLIFQSLFQGIALLGFHAKCIFIASAGALAFTGGLALACFVKAFGTIFLARPRSLEIIHVKESSISLKIGMFALAVLSLLFGLFSGYLINIFEKIGKSFDGFKNISSFVSSSSNQTIAVGEKFASVSASVFFILFVSVILLVIFVIKYVINRKQRIKIGETWDCGTDLTSRMEITATGFARSLVIIFKGILKPSIQHEIEYDDSESRYLPKSRTVVLKMHDLYQYYFYQPLQKILTGLSMRIKNIQSGNVNAYILYIFIALAVTLYSVL